MKTFFAIILTVLCLSAAVSAGDLTKHKTNGTDLTSPLISFTENKGQIGDQHAASCPDVLFAGTDGQLVFHLKKNGISYQQCLADTINENTFFAQHKSFSGIAEGEKMHSIGIYRTDVEWLNCNSNPEITRENALPGYSNYYSAVCPDGVLNVQSYTDVTYGNIYPGIDLKWYTKDGQIKYDFNISAGADYRLIQLKITGAEKINITAGGELVLQTPYGKIIEAAPLVIQQHEKLESRWSMNGNVLGFYIDGVNPGLPFVIDPAVRSWGTYYGSDGFWEKSVDCKADASGNVFITGDTQSTLNIATSGSHQVALGGSDDCFIAKFNGSGARQWGTYYGGLGGDYGYRLFVDPAGNIFAAGYTNSPNAIATAGSHQPVIGGGIDAFLVKFNSSGVRQWGTYYGGLQNDLGYGCTVDLSGNIYLVGSTLTSTGTTIATAGSHQPSIAWNAFADAFIVKFNSSGARLWGTYYGGTGEEDFSQVTTDASGNVYMSGTSGYTSGTWIATPGSHQPGYVDYNDAYLVKFNSSGVRQWGTYYGGTGFEVPTFVATDPAGNIYMAGYTETATPNVIATAGSHQSTFGGLRDGFLVKFNTAGVRLWGTYYGGSGTEAFFAMTFDPSGFLYLSGSSSTASGTAIATPGSYQTVNGGGDDAFMVKFNSNGVRQDASYYGDWGQDYGYGCASDPSGNIFMTGTTSSPSAMASAGSSQPVKGTGYDGYLVRFGSFSPLPITGSSLNGICENGHAKIKWTSFTEVNNAGFDIEKSKDASVWTKIGYVDGHGNSTVSIDYAFTEEEKINTLNYYRYKQIDYDGHFAYSNIIAVRPCDEKNTSFYIFPNPASSSFTVASTGWDEVPGSTTTISVEIFDVLGNIAFATTVSSTLVRVQTEKIPDGVYSVMIKSGDKGVTQKLVVQH